LLVEGGSVFRLDPIPPADDEDGPNEEGEYSLDVPPITPPVGTPSARPRSSRIELGVALFVMIAVGLLHVLAIWHALGGLDGLTNGWPLARDDHPLYYHSALVTRAFLKQTGTTAGYDPAFMAGYAKSVVFPASSTLPELVVALFGGDHPDRAYKLYVLIAAGIAPGLVTCAGYLWKLRPMGMACAMLLQVLYVWTDFPINYVGFGMVPYFLGVPLALVAAGAFARFLEQGGLGWWVLSASLMSASVLVHLTTAMILLPAAALAYLSPLLSKSRIPGRRHLGVSLIPVVVLAANAFWWLPGIWLASTKGPSDFAFNHPEGVLQRLGQIASREAPIETILLAIGLPGLAAVFARGKVRGPVLAGFAASGFFWGYLAGNWRSLDFLQPGRHTYAFYSALALAGGAGWDELRLRLRLGGAALGSTVSPIRLDRWVSLGLILITVRMTEGALVYQVRANVLAAEPFLSSRPSARLRWVVDHVKANVKPGERLFYEEGGKDLPNLADPYHRGRFSGLLPEMTGVEVVGGPYLYSALTTNFTQFGEGMLCGKKDWGREDFVRYARIYRPAAILCWTPHARQFCKSNPDLIRIVENEGALLIGRVLGFEGDVIEGQANVAASPGQLSVREMTPGVDGSVVLRYHSVPCLSISPSIPWDPVSLEDDPVPFIRLRPPSGTRDVTIELRTLGFGL
jgi:hypothetical protein